MKPFLGMLQFVFGCRHGHLSRVFTIQKRTYQVCFDCGQQIEYSWALMQSVPQEDPDDVCTPLDSARHAVASKCSS